MPECIEHKDDQQSKALSFLLFVILSFFVFLSFVVVVVVVLARERSLEGGRPQNVFYRTLVRSLCPDVCPSVRHLWLDLTDVTLADEDTNSILTDNANRAIQVNVATN